MYINLGSWTCLSINCIILIFIEKSNTHQDNVNLIYEKIGLSWVSLKLRKKKNYFRGVRHAKCNQLYAHKTFIKYGSRYKIVCTHQRVFFLHYA